MPLNSASALQNWNCCDVRAVSPPNTMPFTMHEHLTKVSCPCKNHLPPWPGRVFPVSSNLEMPLNGASALQIRNCFDSRGVSPPKILPFTMHEQRSDFTIDKRSRLQ
jgi:hypothetical protein